MCVADAQGTYSCPLGSQHECLTPMGGGTPMCSPNACTGSDGAGIEDDPIVDDPGAPADGEVDAEGHCLGNIEIFAGRAARRSEEHTSELQSLMRISYAVFCLKKNKKAQHKHTVPNVIKRKQLIT